MSLLGNVDIQVNEHLPRDKHRFSKIILDTTKIKQFKTKMQIINDIKQLELELQQLMRKQLPAELANYAVNFYKENFKRQGWAGTKFERWKKTQTKEQKFGKSSGILVGTGNLKKSIRINKLTPYGFVISAGNQKVKYATIHNEGGYLYPRITAKSRKFFWYMFKKTGDEMWKRMALTKKQRLKIKIDKRQFIGPSETLNEELIKKASKKIKQTFYKHINFK